MDFSDDILRTVLVYGGIPALALLVFYGLLRGGWGSFKFEPISSTGAAVIALGFLVLLGFIAYLALTRFDVPDRATGYFHRGELRNLVSLIGKDPNAPFSIRLAGNAEDKEAMGRLHFDDTKAASYQALVEKLCAARSECIRCDTIAGSPTVISVSKTGDIAPSCKFDGDTVYCCA
jgi:hypothetical protein